MDNAAGDNQCDTKDLGCLFNVGREKAGDEGVGVRVAIDESGDGKVISPSSSPNTSLKDNDNSSTSVESVSRKYLSIAHIVTNMKARWEVFAMENEIDRCKCRDQKNRHGLEKHVADCSGVGIENTVFKSSSAPDISTPSGLATQEPLKSLSPEDNIDMKKARSALDIRLCCNSDIDNAYNIESCTSSNDFEGNSIECRTPDITELGSIISDKTCHTAVENSSEDTSLSYKSRKIIKETCNCPTHILPCEKNSSDASVEDKELSFGLTYTIADTNCSCKSCSLHPSSSFAVELENHPKYSGTTNKSSRRGSSSTNLKLEELSRDYDNVVLAKNDPVVWNVRTSSTQLNQCYNNWQKEIPDQKICSNVSSDSDITMYPLHQNVCKKCTRGIFPGQAKFVNPIEKQLAWHKNCFRCSERTCQKELHNFDHILYNSEPFCYKHYIEKSKASRCKSCYEFIVDETYTHALEDYWHQNHFTCGYCRTPLINSEFITIENSVICLPCHRSLFKKNCQSCGKFIEIHQRFVHSGDLFWHSNDSCMKCETCSNSLIGRTRFYRKVGHLYCNRFCSQQRGPP